MGNTDIVATSLPDANAKNTTGHSTIFDDVFRTIAQKMPQLLIPLINEVFHTSYSEAEHFEQLRNEHYEKYGTIITDSIIRIDNRMYHLECQSTKDETMVIRMFEYDISIAIEHASLEENDIWEIEFPQSCVLYIRNHRSLPEYHGAIVKFADGQEVHYRVPVLQAKKYTVDQIFEKRLLILLPYHILRYEHFLKHNGTDSKKLQHLLDDFRKINHCLEKASEKESKSHLYMNMIVLIVVIAVKDKADVDEAKESLTKHQQDRYNLLQSYEPKQVSRIQDGLVFTKGQYAVLIITSHNDDVRKAFEDTIKSK